MAASHVSLLIPQLLWPEPNDAQAFAELSLPGLEKLLARGRLQHLPALPYETSLAACFGRDAEAPFGALRLLGEEDTSEAGNGHWVCADPIHLRHHHEHFVVAGPEVVLPTATEATELTQALNGFFGDRGRFHFQHPWRWYFRPHAAAATTPELIIPAQEPLSAIAGRALPVRQEESAETRIFRQWQNELQMFLHAHPVNQQRESSGLPTINSLWFWGGGEMRAGRTPAGSEPGNEWMRPFASVRTADSLAAGLAHAAGIPVHPAARELAQVLALSAPGSSHLIVIDDLLEPALYEDKPAWRNRLAALERAWFAPLAAGRPASASIVAPTAYGLLRVEWRAFDRFRFWQPAAPLGTVAARLAR